jgi:hypothetical protein
MGQNNLAHVKIPSTGQFVRDKSHEADIAVNMADDKYIVYLEIFYLA